MCAVNRGSQSEVSPKGLGAGSVSRVVEIQESSFKNEKVVHSASLHSRRDSRPVFFKFFGFSSNNLLGTDFGTDGMARGLLLGGTGAFFKVRL